MREPLTGDFHQFRPFLAGGGSLAQDGEILRLSMPPVSRKQYADGQIDDYHGLRRSRFPWTPPLRLRVRARASHRAATSTPPHFHTSASTPPHLIDSTPASPHLLGTAGFGFWNDPFTLTGGSVLAAPSVLWFFYASPPSDMARVEGVPGWGWKAATLDSARIPALLLGPAAAIAVLLTKIPGLGLPVMASARRAMRISERLLDTPLVEWHDYEIEWGAHEAIFHVDGHEVLRAPDPPRGPLGFVAWIDNQYAVATPQGKFGFGLVETHEPQWLELQYLNILTD
jgi:hypothetical protein